MLKQKEGQTKAVKLDSNKILEILKKVPQHMLQGGRMFEYLAQNPNSPTGYVAHHCSIGNLSDVAHYINPHIFKEGLMIGCEKPSEPIINKFGEKSNQFLWSVYEVEHPLGINEVELTDIKIDLEAANESVLVDNIEVN